MLNLISKLQNKLLTREDLHHFVHSVASENFDAAGMKNFLIAWHRRGEQAEEIATLVRILRERAEHVSDLQASVFDCCGTGGDHQGLFNLSTATAFVLAACGISVAKHGNRAVSSNSGSADFLSALGIPCYAQEEKIKAQFETHHITFLAAFHHYPFLKNLRPIRQSISHPTIFNLLGPLLNPAKPARQMIGVWSPSEVERLAHVVQLLDYERVLIFSSAIGADEILPHHLCKMADVKKGHIEFFDYELTETDFDKRDVLVSLKGNGAESNAERFFSFLQNPESEPILLKTLALNAGWGLVFSAAVGDCVGGMEQAEEAILSGKVFEKIREMQS